MGRGLLDVGDGWCSIQQWKVSQLLSVVSPSPHPRRPLARSCTHGGAPKLPPSVHFTTVLLCGTRRPEIKHRASAHNVWLSKRSRRDV